MDLGFSKHVCVGLCSNWACVSPDRLRGYQQESSGQTKPGGSVAGRFTSAGATPPFSPGRGHCPRLSPVSSSSSVPRPRPLLTPFAPPPPPLHLYLLIWSCETFYIHLLPNPPHCSPPKQLPDCRLECLQLPSNLGHEAPVLVHHGHINL